MFINYLNKDFTCRRTERRRIGRLLRVPGGEDVAPSDAGVRDGVPFAFLVRGGLAGVPGILPIIRFLPVPQDDRSTTEDFCNF